MHHDLRNWPPIIQGGMGVGVSNWRLARAVSMAGQLGTVSLVALPHVAARRLQLGDTEMLRALAAFPVPEVAEQICLWYWQSERPIPMFSLHPSPDLAWLAIFASFAEVWLAKEGHSGLVAGNLLEKAQTPMLHTMLGAMWAGVDAFLIGAGLPYQIPKVLDDLTAGKPARYRVSVEKTDPHEITLDMETLIAQSKLAQPQAVREALTSVRLWRPAFLPIVSLDGTAAILWKKTRERCDGFIVEDPVKAGGHNPPPRDKGVAEDGQPLYNERDQVNFDRLQELGVPFWIAGGYARPEGLNEARRWGACGIQCGSIFALADESGIHPDLKQELRQRAFRGELVVRSDPRASPTGFPFQVVALPGTVSDEAAYAARPRICNLGYLRNPVLGAKGITYRCAAEPVEKYVRKGGTEAETVGRKCLCNNLLSAVGLGMVHDGVMEPPILTLGQDTGFIRALIECENGSYTATDAIQYLLGS